MVLDKVTRLLKKLGRLRDPRPFTLDEWIAHHRVQVRQDVQRVLPFVSAAGTVVDIGANVGLRQLGEADLVIIISYPAVSAP